MSPCSGIMLQPRAGDVYIMGTVRWYGGTLGCALCPGQHGPQRVHLRCIRKHRPRPQTGPMKTDDVLSNLVLNNPIAPVLR